MSLHAPYYEAHVEGTEDLIDLSSLAEAQLEEEQQKLYWNYFNEPPIDAYEDEYMDRDEEEEEPTPYYYELYHNHSTPLEVHHSFNSSSLNVLGVGILIGFLLGLLMGAVLKLL